MWWKQAQTTAVQLSDRQADATGPQGKTVGSAAVGWGCVRDCDLCGTRSYRAKRGAPVRRLDLIIDGDGYGDGDIA